MYQEKKSSLIFFANLTAKISSKVFSRKRLKIFYESKKVFALKMIKSIGSLRLQPYDEAEINKCKNVEERYVCIHCIEICVSMEKLKLHYINIHGYKLPEPEKKITTKVCTICRMSFKNAKTLSKHVKTVHYKIMSFICSVCSKQFSRKATLDVRFKSIFINAVRLNLFSF